MNWKRADRTYTDTHSASTKQQGPDHACGNQLSTRGLCRLYNDTAFTHRTRQAHIVGIFAIYQFHESARNAILLSQNISHFTHQPRTVTSGYTAKLLTISVVGAAGRVSGDSKIDFSPRIYC